MSGCVTGVSTPGAIATLWTLHIWCCLITWPQIACCLPWSIRIWVTNPRIPTHWSTALTMGLSPKSRAQVPLVVIGLGQSYPMVLGMTITYHAAPQLLLMPLGLSPSCMSATLRLRHTVLVNSSGVIHPCPQNVIDRCAELLRVHLAHRWLTITTPHFLNNFWQNYCQLHWTLYNDQPTTHFNVQSQVIHIRIKICLPKHISLFQNPCPTKQQIINGWSTQVSVKWVLYLTQKKLTHWGSHLCFTWRHGCYRRHLEIAKGPVQKSEKSCQYQ